MDNPLKAYGKMFSRTLDILIITLVILIVGSIFISNFTGSPVLFSYTMTDSMEPTINQGDLFFIMPNFVHTPKENDIIVFEDPDNYRYIVHRVIDVTEEGEYYTRGDNSIFSDQQADMATIDESMIVGTVFSPFNKTITLPKFGSIIKAISSFVSKWYMLIIGVIAILTFVSFKPQKKFKTARETHIRIRHVFVLSAVVIIVWSSLILILSSQTISTNYYVTDNPIDETSILPGDTFEMDYSVEHLGFIPTMMFMTSLNENATIDKTRVLLINDSYEGIMTIQAPEKIGNHNASISVRSYLPLMPADVIEWLYQTHFFLPVIVTDLILLLPLILYYVIFCDGNQYILPTHKKMKLRKKMKLPLGGIS